MEIIPQIPNNKITLQQISYIRGHMIEVTRIFIPFSPKSRKLVLYHSMCYTATNIEDLRHVSVQCGRRHCKGASDPQIQRIWSLVFKQPLTFHE
jgi:hypothetical protein